MPRLFSHVPNQPTAAECQNAYIILCNAHESASSFLDIFITTRQARSAKGAPTDEEQDLLRAMLLFAASGLDSMVKQLIRDALPKVLTQSAGAHAMLETFLSRRLRKGDEVDFDLLAQIVAKENPRERIVTELISDLTSASLQSSDQLLRAASFFDVPSSSITSDVNRLRSIFAIRNQIAHEMDVDFGQPNRNRRPRRRQQMVDETNEVFRVAENFLREVDQRAR